MFIFLCCLVPIIALCAFRFGKFVLAASATLLPAAFLAHLAMPYLPNLEFSYPFGSKAVSAYRENQQEILRYKEDLAKVPIDNGEIGHDLDAMVAVVTNHLHEEAFKKEAELRADVAAEATEEWIEDLRTAYGHQTQFLDILRAGAITDTTVVPRSVDDSIDVQESTTVESVSVEYDAELLEAFAVLIGNNDLKRARQRVNDEQQLLLSRQRAAALWDRGMHLAVNDNSYALVDDSQQVIAVVVQTPVGRRIELR